eukprot:403352345
MSAHLFTTTLLIFTVCFTNTLHSAKAQTDLLFNNKLFLQQIPPQKIVIALKQANEECFRDGECESKCCYQKLCMVTQKECANQRQELLSKIISQMQQEQQICNITANITVNDSNQTTGLSNQTEFVLQLQQDIEENSQLGDMYSENNQTDNASSSTQESDQSISNNQDSHKEQSTEESEHTKDSQIDVQNDDTESLKGTSSQSKSTHSVNKEGYNTGLVILILIVLGLVGVLVIMALRGDSLQMRLKNKHWLYDQQQHSWDSSAEDDQYVRLL